MKMKMKTRRPAKKFFYMVWMPGDCDKELSWYYIYPTRGEAMAAARESYAVTDEGWKVVYSSDKAGKNDMDFWGQKTVAVIQTDYHYHGA